MTVEKNSIVVQSKEQYSAMMDGEIVMIDIEQGKYYGLDGVGIRIWNHLAQPRRVSDLCELLLAEYDVAPASCEVDVLRFLNEMETQRLIESRPDWVADIGA
jgi:hypothetical protein